MKNKKQPLHIFFHIFKCAGTTLKEHILKNFREDEVLLLYGNEHPYLRKREDIERYVKSLTKEQRDKIKVIFGHRVFYGLHKLFPNRETRYVTFLRNPVDRTISDYNFDRISLEIMPEDKRLKKEFIRNRKILNFKEWFLHGCIHPKNFMFRSLFEFFFNEKNGDVNINKENFKKIKRILDKFFFIGVTEKPEDFLFLYNELGIKKFLPNQNPSKKYFTPKDYEKTKKFILSKNKFDKELYNYALKLNKEFKREYKEFNKIVKNMEIKREKYRKTISYYLICLKYKFLQLIYELSARLKKRSKLYTKFIDLIKGEKTKRNKKKLLYIFLHIPKCAGSTIKEHVLKTLKKDEFLFVYGNESPYLRKKEKIKQYINSLTKERKEKIKVIVGHNVYYGIHKLFPNREVRFVLFLRDPMERLISYYNSKRGGLSREPENEALRNGFMRDGKILNFANWFTLNNKYARDFMFEFLFRHFSNKEIGIEKVKANNKNQKMVKRILDKFYFIGVVENPEDFLFVYNKLGINKFFPNMHVSNKYFVPKDYEKTKKFVLSKNKFDKELYEYALNLNRKFRREHKEFYSVVACMKLKKFFYYLLLNIFKLSKICYCAPSKLYQLTLSRFYKLSARLKKRSKLYTKFIDAIKGAKEVQK